MEKHTDRRLTVPEYRHFGFAFGVGMLVLSIIGWWRHFPFPVVLVTLLLWVYHWVVGLLWPRALWFSELVASRLWEMVSHVIAVVVLGLLFYVVFTPFFWVLRLLGQDHIGHNQGNWQDFQPSENDPRRMERWF